MIGHDMPAPPPGYFLYQRIRLSIGFMFLIWLDGELGIGQGD